MSGIESTGRYMPENIIPNSFFLKGSSLFTSVSEYFTGFHERRHAGQNDTALSMARKAAEDALSGSQYHPHQLDLIIGIIFPSKHLYGDDLNLLQHEIDAKNASVLPVNTACSSFLTALNVADSAISSGKKKRVLIVVVANWVNYALKTDEPNYAFAGDGAAALILDDKSHSFIDCEEINNSTPEVFSSMVLKNPLMTGMKEFFTITEPEGISTAKDLVMFPVDVARRLILRNHNTKVDRVIMHQSGLKMMNMWSEKLDTDPDIILHTLGIYANMTMANLPVSLDYWVKKGRIIRGDVILFFSPSAGGHYIAMLWRY